MYFAVCMSVSRMHACCLSSNLSPTASHHQGPCFQAFSARSYDLMHLTSFSVHLPPLSSDMSSFHNLQENSFKGAHFHLLKWTLEYPAAQGVPSPARRVMVPALWFYHAWVWHTGLEVWPGLCWKMELCLNTAGLAGVDTSFRIAR